MLQSVPSRWTGMSKSTASVTLYHIITQASGGEWHLVTENVTHGDTVRRGRERYVQITTPVFSRPIWLGHRCGVVTVFVAQSKQLKVNFTLLYRHGGSGFAGRKRRRRVRGAERTSGARQRRHYTGSGDEVRNSAAGWGHYGRPQRRLADWKLVSVSSNCFVRYVKFSPSSKALTARWSPSRHVEKFREVTPRIPELLRLIRWMLSHFGFPPKIFWGHPNFWT